MLFYTTIVQSAVTLVTLVLAVLAGRRGAVSLVRWFALAIGATSVVVLAAHVAMLLAAPAWLAIGSLADQSFVALTLSCTYAAAHCLWGRYHGHTREFQVAAAWNGVIWAICIAHLLVGTLWDWAWLATLPLFAPLLALAIVGQVRGLARLKQPSAAHPA